MVNDIDPQMLKGLVTLLVLRLLADTEDYGYSLVVRLRAGGLAEVAEGTVYPALARCEQGGWVETHYVPSQKGPARKYYRLSASGRQELAARTASWRELTTLVNGFIEGDLS